MAGSSIQHQGIIANHYNNREDGGHKERNSSNIIHMRNFNNWIKSELINKYVNRVRDRVRLGTPIRALDMCCGKGGDLNKWRAAKIQHLVCTDIADVSIAQCRERYEKMGGHKNFGFKIEYHACDATVDRQRSRYADSSVYFHLVSCQFAFHYCFESLPQAECMLRNASESLEPGGFFFGTMPDANEIMKRRELIGEEEFGNEVYKISFECNSKQPPLFGAKYNFYLDGVVNCPEFLVYFPLLEKLAKKYGLKLIYRESFHNFFRERIECSKYLMERMNAMETYSEGHGGRDNQKDPSNYHVAAAYLKEHPNVHSIGTLSKCEWDTIGLYQVFAFEKVQGKLNDAGEMVYNV